MNSREIVKTQMQWSRLIRATAIGLCGIALLSLTSCTRSLNPITPLKNAQFDDRLIGTWVKRNASGQPIGFVHIGKPKKLTAPGGVHQGTLVGFNDDQSVQASSIQFFISKLGNSYYANLANVKVPEKEDETTIFKFGKDKSWNYVLVKYKVEGSKLLIWNCIGTFVKDEIKSGHILGIDDILTASSEALETWIRRNDVKLFANEPSEEYEKL